MLKDPRTGASAGTPHPPAGVAVGRGQAAALRAPEAAGPQADIAAPGLQARGAEPERGAGAAAGPPPCSCQSILNPCVAVDSQQ